MKAQEAIHYVGGWSHKSFFFLMNSDQRLRLLNREGKCFHLSCLILQLLHSMTHDSVFCLINTGCYIFVLSFQKITLESLRGNNSSQSTFLTAVVSGRVVFFVFFTFSTAMEMWRSCETSERVLRKKAALFGFHTLITTHFLRNGDAAASANIVSACVTHLSPACAAEARACSTRVTCSNRLMMS